MTSVDSGNRSTSLRKRAEELAKTANQENLSIQDAQHLIYELQVHQIELEIQNEELRTAQLDLENSRRKYRDLYEFSPVGLLTLDEHERILEANITLVTMLEVDYSKLTASHLSDFIDPSTQDSYHFFFQGLRTRSTPQQCEIILLQNHQHPIYARLDGTVQNQTGQGQATYRIAVSDVSEQRRLIQTLRDMEQRLKMVINSARDYAIFTCTAEGVIDSWSAGAEQIYGYAADEIMGHSWDMLFSPEDRSSGLPGERLKQAAIKGYSNSAVWHVRKDGTRFFVEGSLRPIYDDQAQIQGFTKIARDVTARKRLEELEHRQHHFTKILQTTAMTTNKSLQLEQVLDAFLKNIRLLFPYDGANIMLLQDDVLRLVSIAGYQNPALREFPDLILSQPLSFNDVPAFQEIVSTRKPLVIPNISHYPGWETRLQPFPALSYIGCPIIVDDAVAGILNIHHLTTGFFTHEHFESLENLTAVAALAIKNALLHQEVQRLTVIEERQSFSRDLHDSLSQLVFTASIITDTLPHLIDKDPEQLKSQVELLRRVTRAVNAEMRKLVRELRSTTVIEIDLREVLHQMADAAMGQQQVDVEVEIHGENSPPLLVQMTFYRIAQEALNNVLKHAHATQVQIILDVESLEESSLIVRDNGRGFDPLLITGFHVGLQSMRERAEKIEADLEIKSQPGKGTEVKVIWRSGQSVRFGSN